MKAPYTDRLKRQIQILAQKRSWTMEQVAQEAGISRSHFFAVIMGTRSPSLASLKKISDALKVDVIDLLKP
jgi:transcriptional regulator with XRE-family HTH domain